ncbi:MAG: CDGSH iron-sulfur domain-containing protein [Proteobacteria bacterium]|nr:CDGSH iron-sulfur domain-containing protein [Pseudomonadota bacterium]
MSEPIRASDKPFVVEVDTGKSYYWCACGKSNTQPFCDGSHVDTEFNPVQYDATESTTIYFCGCKVTKNQPLCDGSHKG